MFTVSDACRAAARFADYESVQGEQPNYAALYHSVGLDQTVLAHMAEHAIDLGYPLDPGSMCVGALLALLMADHDGNEVAITDNDLTELLNPLT